MTSDRVLGAIGLVLGVAFIWSATAIETGFIVDPLGPRQFPIIIGSVLTLASLFVLLRPDPEPHWPEFSRAMEIVIAIGVLVGYALFLEDLGFVIATAIAASLLSWRLGSQLHWSLVTGVGVSLGIYTIFHLVLGLSLAKGPFGF
ncbi:MAG: tripartite tricarboxylate transporter TctB family protein [Rhodomicrobiaceae bacterium]